LGGTAIHYAVRYNQSGTVNFLIGKKANLNKKNNTNETPLVISCKQATRQKNASVVLGLLRAGAAPLFDLNALSDGDGSDDEEGTNMSVVPFLATLDLVEADLINQILEIKPDLLTWRSNRDGYTALDRAILANNIATVEIFRSRKLPCQEKILLKVAGHVRDISESPNIFTYLHGVNPKLLDQIDDEGNNILHVAIGELNYALSKIIYDLKPGLAAKENSAGKLPLHLAVEESRFLVLLEYFAGVPDDLLAQTDKKGDTILHVAFRLGDFDQAQAILHLANSSNIFNVTNAAGKTPFECINRLYSLQKLIPYIEMANYHYLNMPHDKKIASSACIKPR
jgi:ankyrin repeat protein